MRVESIGDFRETSIVRSAERVYERTNRSEQGCPANTAGSDRASELPFLLPPFLEGRLELKECELVLGSCEFSLHLDEARQ